MSLNYEVNHAAISISPLSRDLGRVFPSREKMEAKNCDSEIALQPPELNTWHRKQWIISSLFIKF